jgi:hypothetical protein
VARKSPLSAINWTDGDVGPFIKAVTDMYKPQVATPRSMLALIVLLADMTKRAQEAASRGDLGYALQWQRDMDSWVGRLAHYKEVTVRLAETSPDDIHSDELWAEVIEPVVQGYFPGEPNRKRPDAAVPLMLAHQARVATEAMEDAADKFWIDIRENALKMAKSGKSWGGLALGVAAVLGGLFIAGGRR